MSSQLRARMPLSEPTFGTFLDLGSVAGRCCVVTAPFGAAEERAVGVSVSMDEARLHKASAAALTALRNVRDQISDDMRGRAAVGGGAGTDLGGGISRW